MELLSLQGPPQERVPRLTRTEALLVSFGVHLLVLLVALFAPGWVPESVKALLAPRPPAAIPPLAEPPAPAPHAQPVQPPIPLKFAYVKIPNDTAVDSNPTARLLSDRNRRARQEAATPPDASRLSIDPHSVGDTITRVIPDPTRPEGPDDPEPNQPRPAAAGAPAGEAAQDDGPAGPADPGEPTDGPGAPAGFPAVEDAGHGPGAPGAEELKRAISDLRSGEYKFTFNNPAYLRGGDYGTMSFDTQDFPWGDYARRLYVLIRNNWLARIPLAAREGIAGHVCQRFVISRQGEIIEIRVVRPSTIPPFDKAAGDAIKASSPLPPLPAAFPGASEGVTFCFYYNMYPGEAE